MLHPYTYLLLHKYQRLERIKQAEHEQLVHFLSHPATQLQSIVELSGLISKWWTHRWRTPKEDHLVEGKVVMP